MVVSALKKGLELLSHNSKVLIAAFTVVEVIVLTAWLLLLFPGPAHTLTMSVNRHIVAGLVLAVGLGIEHYIAGASGKV